MAAWRGCVILMGGARLGGWRLRLFPANHLDETHVFIKADIKNTWINKSDTSLFCCWWGRQRFKADLEAETCSFWQVLDLDVKLQPAVPQNLFSKRFRGRSLLGE